MHTANPKSAASSGRAIPRRCRNSDSAGSRPNKTPDNNSNPKQGDNPEAGSSAFLVQSSEFRVPSSEFRVQSSSFSLLRNPAHFRNCSKPEATQSNGGLDR